MPNSKAFKNDNLFMKNKLDIVLREHNGKSKFSIEGKVKKKKKKEIKRFKTTNTTSISIRQMKMEKCC